MTTPETDTGLDAAIQRVGDALNQHTESHPDCSCGWLYLGPELTYWGHVAEALARVAREDVAEIVREGLDATVINSAILDAMHAGAIDNGQTYGQIAERLTDAVVRALPRTDLDKVNRAWNDPGRMPGVHREAQHRLRRDWPTLANALDRL